MLLGTLGASLLENLLTGKGKELVLEKNGIFNTASSLNKFWKTEIL